MDNIVKIQFIDNTYEVLNEYVVDRNYLQLSLSAGAKEIVLMPVNLWGEYKSNISF